MLLFFLACFVVVVVVVCVFVCVCGGGGGFKYLFIGPLHAGESTF